MKSRSITNSGSPRDLVRMRAWRLDTLNGAFQISLQNVTAIVDITSRVKRLFNGEKEPQLTCDVPTEAPRLALEDVETRMNMGQYNGLFRENTSPDRISNGLQKMQSSPMLSTGSSTISALETVEREFLGPN